MSPRQDLARLYRQTLLNDVSNGVREHREREAHVAPIAEAPSSTPTIAPPREAVFLADPAPTPPPAPPTLLTRARTFLARYLAEPEAVLDTLALWALHAHAHARFEVSPRLILHARDASADHARALRILRWLTPTQNTTQNTATGNGVPMKRRDFQAP